MNRTAAVFAMAITTVACGQAIIPDAFTPTDFDASGFYAGQAIEMRPGLRASVAGLDHVVLQGVAVGEGLTFDLDLKRSNPIAEGAVLRLNEHEPLAGPTADIFTGSVQGVPGSLVVLGMSDHFTYGMIQHQGGTWMISSGRVGDDGPIMVFDTADAPAGAVSWGVEDCIVLEIPGHAAQPMPPAEMDGPPCRVAQVAIETDREFLLDLFGDNQAAATDYATLLVAANSEIYTRDLNVRFEIIFLRLWSGSDPWNEDGAGGQLGQFRNTWEANPPVAFYHGAHFFSGRGLGGGVAWLAAMCYPEFNYALSGNLNGFFPYPLEDENVQNWDIMVTAHEWGHNFGAPHTHEQFPLGDIDTCGDDRGAGNPCDFSQLPGTIMSYCHLCGLGLGGVALNFHPQNVNNWMLPFLDDDAQCDMTGSALCEPACAGDIADDFGTLNGGDGMISFGDFLALLGLVGPCPGGTAGCTGDIADDFGTLGGDGMVSFGDFLALLGLIGPCP